MEDHVVEALARATVEELVELSTPEGQRVALAPRVDVSDGSLRWEAEEPLSAYLRTKQWMRPMLNDSRRNRAYGSALQTAVERKLSSSPRGVFVLDVGCGTGLLSMMAVRAAQRLGAADRLRVVACEMQECVAELASKVLEENEMDSFVKVVPKALEAVTFEDLDPEQLPSGGFDIVVSELVDWSLLGEGWIPAMRYVQETELKSATGQGSLRLANDDTIFIPQGARLFTRLVACRAISEARKGPAGRLTIKDKDGKGLVRLSSAAETPGRQGQMRFPVHLDELLGDGRPLAPLTESIKLCDIDVTALGQSLETSKMLLATMLSDGSIDAAVCWFELLLDEDHVYSNAPSAEYFQDHWPCACLPMPLSDQEGKDWRRGEEVQLVFRCEDSSFAVGIGMQAEDEGGRAAGGHDSTEGLFGFGRYLLLSSHEYTSTLRDMIEAELSSRLGLQRPLRVLDMANFGVGAVLAYRLAEGARGASCVSVENDQLVGPRSARFIQLGNGIRDVEGCCVLLARVEQLSLESLGWKAADGDAFEPADVVLFEPYFRVSERRPVVTALQFWYASRCCVQRGLLSSTATFCPGEVVIRFAAVQFVKNAHCAYRSVDSPMGFSHRAFEEARAATTSNLQEPVSLKLGEWPHKILCGGEAIGGAFRLGMLDSKSSVQEISLALTSQITCDGDCHAIALWADYGSVSSGADAPRRLSTGPAFWWQHQEVVFLSKPLPLSRGTRIMVVLSTPEDSTALLASADQVMRSHSHYSLGLRACSTESGALAAIRDVQRNASMQVEQAAMRASKEGRLDSLQRILGAFPDVVSVAHQEASGGKSLLMLAAASEELATVEYLLEGGAPWNAVDRDGRCAGQYCRPGGEVFRLLLNWAARAQLLLGAVEGSSVGSGRAAHPSQGRPGQAPASRDVVPPRPAAAGGQSSEDRLYQVDSSKPDYLSNPVKYVATGSQEVLLDKDGDAVMMEWETPLMRRHAYQLFNIDLSSGKHAAVDSDRQVLNVGFGMGIIDGFIQEIFAAGNAASGGKPMHSIVEAHEGVLGNMKQGGWVPGGQKIGLQVLGGRWQDVLNGNVGPFDGIFFDTFGEKEDDILTFFGLLPKLLKRKPDAVFSFFNGFAPDNEFFHRVAAVTLRQHLVRLGLSVTFRSWPIEVGDDDWKGVRRRYWHDSKIYYAPECRWADLQEPAAVEPGAEPAAKRAKTASSRTDDAWPFC